MVRYCIVENCKESDVSILSHRFPKNLDHRQKWVDALNIRNCDLETLFTKYVVCSRHFNRTDYRNALSTHLNTTAIPHLDVKVKDQLEAPTRSTVEIVEIVEAPKGRLTPESVTVAKEPEKVVYETVFSQRRRKRTMKESEAEIKQLTKVAFKKMEKKVSVKAPSVVILSNEVLVPDPKCEYTDLDHVAVKQESQILEQKTSEPVPTIIEIVLAEAACQTEDTDPVEKDEFESFSRADLIKLLREKDKTIETLQKKIDKFEAAMSAFKVLMNPLD